MKNVVFRMLHRVALVRTDVSEEPSTSIIRVTRIGELGTTLAVSSNRRTLRSFSEGQALSSCGQLIRHRQVRHSQSLSALSAS
jgi:hypothetical protein